MSTPIIHQFDVIKQRVEELSGSTTTTAEDDYLPLLQDLLAAERAILKPSSIMAAFTWTTSVQGHRYWHNICRNGHTTLSKKILRSYVKRWKAGELTPEDEALERNNP